MPGWWRRSGRTSRWATPNRPQDLLDALRPLPNAADDVAQMEASLKTLTKVRPMLAQAASLLQQGKVDQPQGGSALDLYHQVQQLDPDNAMAEQGIFQVQRAVLDRALAAVAQNDFAAVDRALAAADAIRPGSQQLQDVRNRVDGIRHQRAVSVLAQARSALDAGNLELAKQLAGQAQSISRKSAASTISRSASPMRGCTRATSRARSSATASSTCRARRRPWW